MNSGLCIALWLLGNLGAVAVYDVIAYWFLPPDESVSWWLQKWLTNWPMGGVFLGIVIGHLAWPLHRSGESLVQK
jgi:hypothetical protein